MSEHFQTVSGTIRIFIRRDMRRGRMVDTLHWDDDTYMDLVSDVILKAAQKRQEALGFAGNRDITACDGVNLTETDEIME